MADYVNYIYAHPSVKWITAHRQTWFDSGGTDFTPERRHQHEEQTLGYYLTNAARWRDLRSQEDLSAILFDLVAKRTAGPVPLLDLLTMTSVRKQERFLLSCPRRLIR